MCLSCHNCASDAVVLEWCTCLEIQWLLAEILAGRTLRERQCTLEGEAQYVNVRGSTHWKGVYKVEGANFFN